MGRETSERIAANVQREVAKQVAIMTERFDELEERFEALTEMLVDRVPAAASVVRNRRPEDSSEEGAGEEGRGEGAGEEGSGQEGAGQEGAREEGAGQESAPTKKSTAKKASGAAGS